MATPIGEAFVRVSPNLTGFSAKLKAEIKLLLPEGVPIRIRPDLTGFRTALRAELTSFAPAPIKLTPDIAGFRAKVEAELKAVGGISVPVTPRATGPAVLGTAAVAPAAAAETGAVLPAAVGTALEAATNAADAAAAAVTALTAAMGRSSGEAAALGKLIGELAVLEDRLARSAANAAVSLDDTAGATRIANNAIKNSEQAISLHARAQAIDNEQVAANAAAIKDSALHQLAFAEAQHSAATATDELIGSTSKSVAETEADKQAKKDVVALDRAIAVAQRKIAESQDLTIASTSKLATAQARLTATTAALKAAQAAYNKESELGIPLDKSRAAELVKVAAANEQEARTALQAAQAEAKRSAELATGLRGGGATGLAAFGLRGATLAASAPFLAGAASATVILKSANAAANFLKQLFILQDVSGATNAQLKDLSATALQLGKDLHLPEVSAQDAAVALTDLVQAGFSVKESLQSVRGALLLAASAQIDTAQATEILVKTMETFGLHGNNATRVVNDLTNAALHAEGTVVDFAGALSQIGAVAARGGLSLENTTAILITLAKGGFTGAAAGTALRQALVRLENPTNATASVLKALNVQLRDANGNIKPTFLVNFANATKDLPPALRDTVVAAAFGARAVKAFDIAAREGSAGLQAAQKSLLDQTAAQKLAEAQTQGLSGHLKELQKNANTVGVQFGQTLTPALTGLTTIIGGALHSLSVFGTGVGAIVGVVGHASGALTALTKAFSVGFAPVAAYVGLVKVLPLLTARAEAVQLSYARALVVSAGATAKEAAALEGDALAQRAAAAAAEGGIAARAGAAFTASGLIGKLTLAGTAAVLLGTSLSFLFHKTDETKQAMDELAASAQKLSAALNPKNVIAERKAIEDLAQAAKDAAAAQDALVISGGRPGALSIDPSRAAKAGADATDLFIKKLRESAAAVQDFNPLLAHNRNLLADFARAIGRIPSQKEIKLVANNRETKTSIDQIINQIEQLGIRGAQDAAVAREKISHALSFGGGVESPTPVRLNLKELQRQFDLALKIIKENIKGQTGKEAQDAALSLVEQIAAQGPAGVAILQKYGKQLGDAITNGFTQAQQDQLAAANKAIQDAIAQGNQQIQSSISSAKSNLGSLAQTLAGSIGQILDARATAAIATLDKSNLAKEIKSLQGQLDKSNIQSQRAQLVFAIGQAVDDSSRRAAIAALNQFDLQTKLTADQKKLQSEKDTATKRAQVQKDAITKNLAAYADEFAKGQITLAQFQDKVMQSIHDKLPGFQSVGKLLGSAFVSSFNAELTGIFSQAAALVGFTGGTGTTQVGITKPAEIAHQVAQSIADAKKNRDDLLAKFKGAQGVNQILLRIEKELKKPAAKTNTVPNPNETTTIGNPPHRHQSRVRGFTLK